MPERKHHPIIEIIIASTRPNRVGKQVADWLTDKTNQYPEAQFVVTDLAAWELPLLNEPLPARDGKYAHAHTKAWSEHIAKADGYIIVTPEYNAGYPASLKNALDYLHDEWAHKPVALVGYGWAGGRRGIAQLEKVLDNFRMIILSERVNIDFRPDLFNEQALFADPDATLAPYDDALAATLQAIVAASQKGESYNSPASQ